MFKCEKCGRVTEPREKLTKIPVLMRERVYQQEVIKNKRKKTVTSFGQEIIKEINLCERCAMEDNKAVFIELLQKTGRPGIENLIDYLKNSDFFEAPASTKYHLSCAGGLLQHSLNVYYNLKKLNDYFFSEDTIILVALLHDVCKANTYKKVQKNIQDSTGAWSKKDTFIFDELLPLGHGEKSVILLQKYIDLTVDEILAIRWHMGGFEAKENYKKIQETFNTSKLAVLLHMSDLKATFLDEREG